MNKLRDTYSRIADFAYSKFKQILSPKLVLFISTRFTQICTASRFADLSKIDDDLQSGKVNLVLNYEVYTETITIKSVRYPRGLYKCDAA